MGFDEPAGNFQTNNFGRGGLGNDSVILDAQDGNGTGININNANWTGAGQDGTENRVQMYIYPANSLITDRDGDLDGDVVTHELTHGLSTRLHHGLDLGQPRGMGEGWSDFFAIAMNAEPGDDPDAIYPFGGYAHFGFPDGSLTANYYFGSRRFPYSTNTAANPQTFADIDPLQQSYPPSVPRSPVIGNAADEVHNMGEVWCNTLHEGRAALWHRYGYAGNQTMLQLVVDGMKLAATSTPTMLIERDAILQADMLNNGRANHIPLWQAFAKRGMGSGAVSTDPYTTVGVVESFDAPVLINFAYQPVPPEQVYPTEATPLVITLTPSGLTLTPNTLGLNYSVNNEPFQRIAATQLSPTQYAVAIPPIACLESVSYYFDVSTNLGVYTDPPAGSSNPYVAMAYTGIATEFRDDGETDAGWTVTLNASAGRWQRGVPVNNGRGDPPSDSPDSGLQCWLTDNNPNTPDSDVDGGITTMTSPVFNAAAGSVLSYQAWLNSNNVGLGAGDGLFVDIASDPAGTQWRRIKTYSNPSPAWRSERIVFGQDVPASPTTRVRFIASDAPNGNVVEAAVDDIRVESLTCDTCPADFNRDGGVDGSDVEAFFLAWADAMPRADVNQDGGVDGSDVEYFFVRWQAGGC